MTRKIFLHAFALGALVLALCSLILFGVQYSRALDETYAALQAEASYAASGLEIGGIRYLQSLDNTNRVTWIDADGEVLYDSEYPEGIANQAKDREVRQALETGSGQVIRRSTSGGAQMMYYAFRCEDGTVLRLSRPLSAVRSAFLAVSPGLWVILLVLLISAATAFRIAQSIAGPVNEMELEDLPNAAPYPELQPLVERMLEQREIIARQAVEQEQVRREAVEAQTREQERMRREFSANVSHELKTPLTSISGFAELMSGGLCDEATMIEFAGDIYRESQRLIALVNDIIRISELDEGELLPDSGEVDLVETARNVIDILRPAADKRHIELEIEADIEEPARAVEPAGAVSAESAQHAGSAAAVTGTARLIEEMVYNLCDNAVKYNREGGRVLVRIWKEGSGKADGASGTDPDPSFGGAGSSGEDKTGTGTDQSGAVCISVEDTGIGIPEEEQERVFERFYRVDKSHSRKMGGTGLGLSIVKHTAQLHGASVDLESHPGEGTKITVRFPKKEDAAAIGDGGQDEQDRVL